MKVINMQKIKSFVFPALGVLCLGAALTWVFCFTSLGWFWTISWRGYTELTDGVYVNEDFQHSKQDVLKVLEEAEKRVENFWGKLTGKPTIIISDDEKDLCQMGWTGNPALTTTVVFFGAHNYVLISPDGFNVDVAAHELTHAELHRRLYQGRIFSFSQSVPLWFDEGVALQNDWREIYDLEACSAAAEMEATPDLDALETPEQFYVSDPQIRHNNYVASKQEVSGWILEHGMEGFIRLIDQIRIEGDFRSAYYDETW